MKSSDEVIHVSIVFHNPNDKGVFLLNTYRWSRLAPPPHAALIHPVFDVAKIHNTTT